jgi:hypothetical protein
VLPPNNGKKRNGMATLPPEFVEELKTYLKTRGNPSRAEPLFVSHDGTPLERRNVLSDFKRAVVLGFLQRLKQGARDSGVDPVEVAHVCSQGVGAALTDHRQSLRRKKLYGLSEQQQSRLPLKNSASRCSDA